MELADWLLQIEKVASLTHSQECKLATAKSTITPYKVLKRTCNNVTWQDIERKLEDVYASIPMEGHTVRDLHRKQRPDEILQEYIHHFTDLTEKQ